MYLLRNRYGIALVVRKYKFTTTAYLTDLDYYKIQTNLNDPPLFVFTGKSKYIFMLNLGVSFLIK